MTLRKDNWNEVLEQVSERLLNIKRESDTLAYVDNNEFAFILENVKSESATTIISDRVLGALSHPIEFKGENLLLQATISICKLDNEKYLTHIKEGGEILDFLVDRKIVAVL